MLLLIFCACEDRKVGIILEGVGSAWCTDAWASNCVCLVVDRYVWVDASWCMNDFYVSSLVCRELMAEVSSSPVNASVRQGALQTLGCSAAGVVG